MSKTIYYSSNEGKELTEEQKAMIRKAAKSPITFDEDCPELSPTMIKAFRCAVSKRNRHRTPPILSQDGNG